jgi:hypothetical protein
VTGWGERVAQGWVVTYTRGLPAESAERRRDELASDLFEHASLVGPSSGHQTEVLGRVLWGIPADLSWRRAARAPRLRRLATGETMTKRKVANVLFVVYILFNVWAAIGVLFNPDGGGAPYATGLLTAAGLMGFGLYWRDDAPRRATVLLSLGAIIPAFTFFWMAPIFGPLGLVLAWLAITSEPGRRTPVPAV